MSSITLSNSKPITYNLPIAGFGRRFGAVFIDLFLFIVLVFLLKIALPDFSNFWFFEKATPFITGNNNTNWVLSKSSLMGLWIIYSIIMDCSTMQGTVGKQIMHIIVTDNNGNRITLFRSLHRNLFKIISFVVIGFGFIYVLVDKKNRGWHDIAADTLVIQNP